MASYEGLRYADLLRMIIEAAQERVASQTQAADMAGQKPAMELV
jgi:hypothetical protein